MAGQALSTLPTAASEIRQGAGPGRPTRGSAATVQRGVADGPEKHQRSGRSGLGAKPQAEIAVSYDCASTQWPINVRGDGALRKRQDDLEPFPGQRDQFRLIFASCDELIDVQQINRA